MNESLSIYDSVKIELSSDPLYIINEDGTYNKKDIEKMYGISYCNLDNPFVGSPVKAKFSFPIINQINYTGEYYKPGVPVSHLNIIRKAYGL